MHLPSTRYLISGLAVVIAALALTGSQVASFGADKPPPKLSGEQLVSTKGLAGTASKCTPAKASSGSFTFSTSGKALGPYRGTFTAAGAVTVSHYAPTRYTVTIHVVSSQGKVTITESLNKSAVSKAFCLPGWGLAAVSARFSASVVVAGHTSKQSGTSAGSVAGGSASRSGLRLFLY